MNDRPARHGTTARHSGGAGREPRVLRSALILTAAVVALAVQAACARSVDGSVPEQGIFAGNGATRTACIETECPAPFATCEGRSGLCTVDLSSDVRHCGSCDTACLSTSSLTPWTWVCSEGQCRLACEPSHADCNGLESDGCETSVRSDPANCGACGNVCADGVVCWRGACGCPSGFTQCGDDCVRLDSDNENCGACGSVCTAPASDTDPRWSCGPGITPPHTEWTCSNASCDLQCAPEFGDCNKDFCGDGCETSLANDPANCGACGHACTAGQKCQHGTCLCPPGTTMCGGICVDYLTDPANCGDCMAECPGPPSSSGKGGPTCVGGECGYVCFPGFADCDGSIENGCEANLQTSQHHCGSCGTSCDVANGQPCVRGTCLTKPCEEPVLN